MRSQSMPWTGVAPRPTGASRIVNFAGKLFAWHEGNAVLLRMPGSPASYLACFSSEEGLRALYARAAVPFTSIKLIEDHDDFVASIAEVPGVVLILDPRYRDDGKVAFTQALLGNGDEA